MVKNRMQEARREAIMEKAVLWVSLLIFITVLLTAYACF